MVKSAKGFLAAALLFLASSVPVWGAEFHIGVLTGTLSQSEDDLRGAERLVEAYGSSTEGGMVTHLTYPDNFMSAMETTVSQLAGLADDPKMKVVVVNQAVPGTAEGFRRIREKRPDILLFAGEAHEDPGVITAVADLVVNADNIARGYRIPWAAQALGAKTFVHISIPRHMGYETLARRRAIMEAACEELGVRFASETAPDPTSDVGTAGAQQFILDKFPAWLEKYGEETAFFCTNDAHTAPLLQRIAEWGGIFIEADLPSPLMGYPGAFGIDLSGERGNWSAILKKVEAAVVLAGGGSRMGTGAFSHGTTTTAALAEFGKRVVEGGAKIGSLEDLVACYNQTTPGAQWSAGYFTDAATGVRDEKFILVHQDTYILGKGYLGVNAVEVPEKYFKISR